MFEVMQEKETSKSMLTLEDFSVTIKNLPKQPDNISQEEFKAKLWNHLEEVLKDEPQCIDKLAKKQKY